MIRLLQVSALAFIFTAAVTGFTLQRSFDVVTSIRPLSQLPTQRRFFCEHVLCASTSSNEEVTTTTTSTIIDSNNAGSTTATTADATTTTTTASDAPLIIVNGHNIELTSSLVEYINKRIGNILSKLANSGAVRECDVVLSVNKNPKVKNGHRVEIVTNVKGTTIICKNESPDMYTSIDASAHALQRKLVKYKERRTDGWHGASTNSLTSDVDDDEEFTLALAETITNNIQLLNGVKEPESSFVEEQQAEVDNDPSRKVVKIQSFQLDKGVSLNEAIFALDYVDHDFYVFRNEETNEINVIYKRHHGGIGLIEP